MTDKIYNAINFSEKLDLFSKPWSPNIIAELNDYQFKLVKLKGHFVWHQHADTDEAFIVLKGYLTIMFRDGRVNIAEGEMYVIPRGVEHKPVADKECHVLIVEPKGVLNTGDTPGELTAPNDVWI